MRTEVHIMEQTNMPTAAPTTQSIYGQQILMTLFQVKHDQIALPDHILDPPD